MGSRTVIGEAPSRRLGGFTLIELLAVMVIVALLLTLASPRLFVGVERAREAVLKENLEQMRDALQQFLADHGKYPDTLDELVLRRYLRTIPMDPITGSDRTWIFEPPADTELGRIQNVRSGAEGASKNGISFGAL